MSSNKKNCDPTNLEMELFPKEFKYRTSYYFGPKKLKKKSVAIKRKEVCPGFDIIFISQISENETVLRYTRKEHT